MDVQYVDRILICSDCHGEFVFTAGEQLFFHDKQFKNDPKRCKPCKSRRSGLSAAASGAGPAAAGLSRVETRTECSECGVQTTVPFKPTQGRPVLCRQCFQSRNQSGAVAAKPAVSAAMSRASRALGSPRVAALTEASKNASGEQLSVEAAVQAAASMAAASPRSSVASEADLASITTAESQPAKGIPTELLASAASDMGSSELLAASPATPESSEA